MKNGKNFSFLRIFSGVAWKGTKHYLKTQRIYEIIRTILFFSLSAALFITGWVSTGTRKNLLTIVAVLGVLPASKALVSVIMFFRHHGLKEDDAEKIEPHAGELSCLYDMVFTGKDHTFEVGHLTVKGNQICGFSSQNHFDEQAFSKHLTPLLKADSYKDVGIKIFTDVGKYVDRLEQLKLLSCNESNTAGIMETLKNVTL